MQALSLGQLPPAGSSAAPFWPDYVAGTSGAASGSGGGCAAQRARTVLLAKKTPTASDARLLELAFELRLSSFESGGHPQETA